MNLETVTLSEASQTEKDTSHIIPLASGPITSWQVDGEAMKTVRDSF